MTDPGEHRPRTPAEPSTADGSWLTEVAHAAGREAGGVPVELLGDYLTLLADAATTGRKPHPSELAAVGLLGRRAAELGVSAGSAVQLYLCAARRLWGELPMVIRSRDSAAVRAAADAVLHVVDAAVASLAEGYTEARRQMVRWEETLRREFIDDLLRGDAIVDECRDFIEIRARDSDVRVDVETAPEPLLVRCERVLTGQVLLNLAFNAVDEMAGVPAGDRLVRLRTWREADTGCVAVEDRGRGASHLDFDRVFESAATSKATGSGIGLGLSYRIITRQHGTISAAPAHPQGSVFSFALPLVRSD